MIPPTIPPTLPTMCAAQPVVKGDGDEVDEVDEVEPPPLAVVVVLDPAPPGEVPLPEGAAPPAAEPPVGYGAYFVGASDVPGAAVGAGAALGPLTAAVVVTTVAALAAQSQTALADAWTASPVSAPQAERTQGRAALAMAAD